jgi:hypothetical protein
VRDFENRVLKLCGRATLGAWADLHQLLDHPKFPELLVHLEKVDGTLVETDIEEALHLLRCS